MNTKREAKAQSRSQTGAPSSSSRPRPWRSAPPYNPGLQKLVAGKQAWAVPLNEDAKAKGFRGWHQRGYLPHYDAPGVTQLITLRLVDSLPASRRGEWEHLLRIEKDRESLRVGAPACHRPAGAKDTQSRSQTGAPPAQGAPTFRRLNANKEQTASNAQSDVGHSSLIRAQSRSQTGAPSGRERRRKLEEYLDRGLGECWLRQPAIAELTEGALRFFDGERYRLGAWVVMPNHVHVLVEMWDVPLSELIKSWKDFVAKQANKRLKRHGSFWEREYLDTVIEDEEHRQTVVRYIENNPTKARLALDPKEWPWSSARWRDEYGVLKLPKPQRSADVSSAQDSGRSVMFESQSESAHET